MFTKLKSIVMKTKSSDNTGKCDIENKKMGEDYKFRPHQESLTAHWISKNL